MTKHLLDVPEPVAGKPTKNGRVYPEGVLELAVGKFNRRCQAETVFGGVFGEARRLALKDVAFKTNAVAMNGDGSMFVEIELLATEAGETVRKMIEDGATSSVMIGTGIVVDGVVQDLEIASFAVMPAAPT
jgi:hypothetical protein